MKLDDYTGFWCMQSAAWTWDHAGFVQLQDGVISKFLFSPCCIQGKHMHNDLRFAPTYMLLRSNSGTDIVNLVTTMLKLKT